MNYIAAASATLFLVGMPDRRWMWAALYMIIIAFYLDLAISINNEDTST